MKKRSLAVAVELGARCDLGCEECRHPEHLIGDLQKVVGSIQTHLPGCDELYLTSTGETGQSPVFQEVVRIAQEAGVAVSVLCATKNSIVPGLVRAEISVNEGTKKTYPAALRKAKQLGIPVVVSLIDNGLCELHPAKIAHKHDVDGVIIRAQQAEGRSTRRAGVTQVWKRSSAELGVFPVAAYAELKDFAPDYDLVCINAFGEKVERLGGITA